MQSRYYDPATHRFINADSLASTGQGILGTNMFAYCLNNPSNAIDLTGNFSLSLPCRFYMLARNEDQTAYIFTGDDDLGKDIVNSLQNSTAMRKLISAYMPQYSSCADGSYTAYAKFNPYESMDDNDYDWGLAYSVGEAQIVMTYNIVPTKGGYTISVSYILCDSYTFEYWESTKGSSFTRFVNNMAYRKKEKGRLTEYSWACVSTYICSQDMIQGNLGGRLS